MKKWLFIIFYSVMSAIVFYLSILNMNSMFERYYTEYGVINFMGSIAGCLSAICFITVIISTLKRKK